MSKTIVIRSISIGLLAIILIAAGAGVYFWQHSKVNNLQKDNQRLQSTVTSLQNTNQQLNKSFQSLNNQAPSSSNPVPAYTYRSAKGIDITVYSPVSGAKISSPVAVIGMVPGNWSFEASFPVKLEDQSGNVIAQANGHVLGTWTTSQLVPFSAQLTYTGARSGSGILVLEKDNPSGLEANQDSTEVPLKF